MATTTTTVAGTIILAAAVLLVAVLPGGAVQSPAAAPGGGGAAPGPSPDCFTYLANVSDCLTYVEAGSNLTKPEKGCCPELAALVENQPLCLCQLLGNSESFGIKLNLNKALKLPSVCGVNAPPVSSCSVAGYPVVGVPMPSASPFSPVLPGGAAQSPAAAPGGGGAAPGPSLDCFTYLANVSDCLTYVEAGSNLTKPEKGCCPELAALVENQPLCLCQLLGNSESFGIKINLNKALKLPSVCGVNAPPVSLCSVAGYPVVGVPMPSASPFSPGGMSPEGLASKPASGNNGSGASGIAVSRLSLVVGLAIGLFFTTALF